MEIQQNVPVRYFDVIVTREESRRHFRYLIDHFDHEKYFQKSSSSGSSRDHPGCYRLVFMLDERAVEEYLRFMTPENEVK